MTGAGSFLNDITRRFAALFRRAAIASRRVRPQRDAYRPERHYMRGPGPKTRAKLGGAPPTGAA